MKPCKPHIAAWGLLLVCATPPAVAVTMVSSDFDSLCAKAEAAVHATVVRQELLPPQGSITAPRMCYELKVVSQLDSRPALAANPRICYLGDLVSPAKTVVAGIRYPVVGETGVFLIKSPNNDAVISPLQGYNQGQFMVRKAAGRDAVFTARGAAVCGFDARLRSGSLDGEVADGLVTEAAKQRCQAMPLTTFAERIRQCRR